jgi:hyperosmotically inducible periplasmic protein
MRYLAIVLASSLAACAAHNAAPAASADSVQAATETPSSGASFAPADSDGVAAAPVDAHWPRTTAAMTPATGNATALPEQSPPSWTYGADGSRNHNGATPLDQSSSESDRNMTRLIRQAVGADRSLSFSAKNVKIITLDGKVTLRGAVKTDDERIRVAAAARKVAGDAQVENFLEVSNSTQEPKESNNGQ